MIYTDRSHLVADTTKELHEFAEKVGLKRKWFQDHEDHPHYDITTRRMFNKIMAEENVKIVNSQALLVCSQFMKIQDLTGKMNDL